MMRSLLDYQQILFLKHLESVDAHCGVLIDRI